MQREDRGKKKKPYNNKKPKFQEGGVVPAKAEEEKPAIEEVNEKEPVAEDEKPEVEEEKPELEEEKPELEEEKIVKGEEVENQGPEETQPVTQAEGKRREFREPRGGKNTKAIQEEVKWFPLEEAKQLCPLLMTISSTPQFLSQEESLQTRADAFMKEKASSAGSAV